MIGIDQERGCLGRWCSGRDSNSHGFLHTPLKRARLPITPPELRRSKNYLFAGASAFAGATLAVGAVVFVFSAPATFEFAFASAAAVFALAFTSVVAAFAFEFASVVFAFVLASAGASGLLERTEVFPVRAGIESNSAETMKTHAATIVTFERTVVVPRGANAELDTLLVKRAPASVFPGCSNTAATRSRQERKNTPYKK